LIFLAVIDNENENDLQGLLTKCHLTICHGFEILSALAFQSSMLPTALIIGFIFEISVMAFVPMLFLFEIVVVT
jgi:hypothetical protein